MNGRAVALLGLIVSMTAVGACSGASAVDVAVPRVEYAETTWEAAYGDSELTTWREGVIRRIEGADHERIDEYPPAAGAVVELFAPHPSGRPPLCKIAETTSGPDGRFRIGPGPAAHWVLSARSKGGAVTYAGNVPFMVGAFPIPEGDVQMMVRDGHPLDVWLTGSGGDALANASVRAHAMGYEELGTTGDDGVAHFVAPAGAVYVEPWDAGRRVTPALFDVPMPAGSEPYVVRAPDRGPLRGWVVDAASGAPLRGAVVRSTDLPDIATTTDAAGHFELDAPRVGRVAVFGRGRAYRSYEVPAAGEIEMRLYPADVVTGRVVDRDGVGVPAARVVAVAAMTDGGRQRVPGPVTDADGRFTFDWLPRTSQGDGASASLVAHRRGLGWSAVESLVAGGTGAERELVLGDERRITGRVARAGDVACAETMVRAELAPEHVSPLDAALLGVAWDVSCQADEEGRFEFVGVPAHLAARLTFRLDGARIERDVEPGADAEIEIVLPVGKSISGRVVDVDGQPVTLGGEARAELLNHPEIDSFSRRAPVGPDGTFRFDDLPDGQYGIRAKVKTFDVGGAVADAGDTGVELVAERPADLDFDIVFPDGAERVPITVTLRDATDAAARPRVVHIDPDLDGARGRIEIVRHGTYDISAAGGPWRCHMRAIAVADGRRPPIQVVLARTIVRRISLQDAGGEPLPGRRIVVAPVGVRGIPPETVITGEGGVGELGGLADGEWLARVVEDGRPPIAQRFTVAADHDEEIILRYPPHGTLEVVIDADVVAEGGAGVISLEDESGASLVAWGPRAVKLASRWRTPADGRLVLRGVLAGTVTVVLTPSPDNATQRTIEVEAGQTTSVRLP